MIMTTVAFPFVSSFHRPRLRPCPRRAVLLLVRSASSSSSSWEEREETRWLREEQRWLREEQRWLREESRWSAEREALLAPAHEQAHRNRLAALGCADDRDLCAKIRDGSLDHRFGDVTEATRAAVVDKLTVANPAHLAIRP
jgi:hypothetical protein